MGERFRSRCRVLITGSLVRCVSVCDPIPQAGEGVVLEVTPCVHSGPSYQTECGVGALGYGVGRQRVSKLFIDNSGSLTVRDPVSGTGRPRTPAHFLWLSFVLLLSYYTGVRQSSRHFCWVHYVPRSGLVL